MRAAPLTSAAGLALPVTVIVAGIPVAKGRPRITRRGIAYTPAATRKYEAHGRLAAQEAMGDRQPIACPVRIVALVELPVPTSWSRARTAAALTGDIRPTTRPDLDNFLKSAMDSINSIVVADDSLVVEIDARKRYGIQPKLVVTVIPLASEPAKRGGAQ
jgi:Holliday junction resolvase RusA-like endonuclease